MVKDCDINSEAPTAPPSTSIECPLTPTRIPFQLRKVVGRETNVIREHHEFRGVKTVQNNVEIPVIEYEYVEIPEIVYDIVEVPVEEIQYRTVIREVVEEVFVDEVVVVPVYKIVEELVVTEVPEIEYRVEWENRYIPQIEMVDMIEEVEIVKMQYETIPRTIDVIKEVEEITYEMREKIIEVPVEIQEVTYENNYIEVPEFVYVDEYEEVEVEKPEYKVKIVERYIDPEPNFVTVFKDVEEIVEVPYPEYYEEISVDVKYNDVKVPRIIEEIEEVPIQIGYPCVNEEIVETDGGTFVKDPDTDKLIPLDEFIAMNPDAEIE